MVHLCDRNEFLVASFAATTGLNLNLEIKSRLACLDIFFNVIILEIVLSNNFNVLAKSSDVANTLSIG